MAPTTCLVGKWNIMKVVISNTSNVNCCQQFQYNLNHKTNPLDVNPSSFQNHRYFAWVKIELESTFLLFLQCWLFTFHKCQLGYLPKYIAYAARFVIPPPPPPFFFFLYLFFPHSYWYRPTFAMSILCRNINLDFWYNQHVSFFFFFYICSKVVCY